MARFSIPAPFSGWGFFLPPAQPSILSTTRQSSCIHQRSRAGRARSSIMALKSWRALIVSDPYVRDLHHRTGTWGRGHKHAEGVGCGCQHHVLEPRRDL
jgi:hypothetical protein